MKVKQNEPVPAFQTITITLETLEEALVMWHALNMPGSQVKQVGGGESSLMMGRPPLPANTSEILQDMWHAYDELRPDFLEEE